MKCKKLTIIPCPNKQEGEFIEALLNQTASGYDCRFSLAMQGLGAGWHIKKLTYYLELIKEVEQNGSINAMENDTDDPDDRKNSQ